MNLDDESLLSAYLDDELDPADRLAVEWSVESSPPLADQLRSLATARDAVSGIGRPAIPVDLAPAITARLAADRRRARLQAMARPGRVALAVAGLSAMAASLLFALLQLYLSTHDGHDPAPLARQNPTPLEHRNHPIEHRNHPISDPIPSPIPSVVEKSILPPPAGTPEPLRVAHESPDELRERADRVKVRSMLENPEVRLVLVATDVIDAAEQIQGLIQKDPRATPDFGRISLRPGLVVDPDRPGSAEVFVVPVVEGGRSMFLDRLRDKFAEVREVDGPRLPELVTQLTEVGLAAVHPGTQASPLVDPPTDFPSVLALRPGQSKDEMEPAHHPRPGGTFDHGPTEPPVDPVRLVGPPTRLKPGHPVTLLVWVTRAGKP